MMIMKVMSKLVEVEWTVVALFGDWLQLGQIMWIEFFDYWEF